MRSRVARLVAFVGVVVATASSAQAQPTPANGTDVYHVHFTKAAPGQAAALGKALAAPDKTSPMPEHFVVLRHQEGDDWDYVVIQHLGPKAEVTAATTGPDAARDLRVWHNDTFVSGPSWIEFTRQMGISGSANAASPVYIVGVHRAVAGHREQLEKALTGAGPASSKIQTGNVLLTHREGSEWTFATITRYNSWSDLASDRAGAASNAAGTPGGWYDVREHSAFHRDTIADRIYPAK
jgi:hypothetical protein